MNTATNHSQLSPATANDPRWAAIAARDQNSDGKFYYSVVTTGVYCRPSCVARLARPENVRFHASCAAAEQAGFRPCKRCKPNQTALSNNYRAEESNTELRFAIGESSLGSILVAHSERGVCAILLGDDADELARDLQDRFPRAKLIGGDSEFEQLIAKVVAFVEAPRSGLELSLDIRGTAFQQRVWQALRKIPVGRTASYTAIAQRIGSPTSARAVAQACAANALAIAIPCHRVVRNDGGLSGYRWGVERKRVLLEREARS
jgi:AraC family transcriptional regulator of adaptative response/methylated-DNA-[protein]-cysteine methyltransferase